MFNAAELVRDAAIRAALSNFAYFHARYFADNDKGIGPMPKFHQEWAHLAITEQRLMLLAPRAHAKTTILSIEYVIYRLCKWRYEMQRNPKTRHPRIGILSDTEDQAESILRAIIETLTRDPDSNKLIQDFGKWKPDSPRKWTTLSIIVDGWHAPNEKDVTIYAGGYESAWLGKRFDLLIVDDLTNLKRNSASEQARANLVQWFKEVLTNCLESHSQMMYVATMQHHQDLTNTIIQEEKERRRTGKGTWTIRRYKAILQEETRTSAPRVLWPEHFSYAELLERRREIGTASFEKQYQNVPINEDLLAFRVAWLRNRCIDPSHSIGDIRKGWGLYLGVDPAMGESHLSSFFAMVLVAYERETKKLYLVDFYKDKIPGPRQEKLINEWWEKYQPLQVRIESNAYQKALAQSLREKYPSMRVMDQFTGKNKIDPEIGVTSLMAPLVENGLLRLPYRTPESVRKTDQFIDDLGLWPVTNADVVMALWIATSAALESSRMAGSRSGIWGTSVRNPMYTPTKVRDLDPQTGQPKALWDGPVLEPYKGGTLERGLR